MTDQEKIAELKQKSIEIIKDGQAETGAYVAGPTFTMYKFSWFRDGSFIADAMSRVGEVKSAEAFFDWGAKVVHSRREKIKNGDFLHARYTIEGNETNDGWPNFQLDGFGTFVWAVHSHVQRHNVAIDRWQEAIDVITDYLAARWREPSHDWWEEVADIHPATLASIYTGLNAVNNPEAGKVRKAIDLQKAKLDASLIVVATPFKVVSDEEFKPVLEEIEKKLVTPGGGVHRHLNDVYYGGGEWLLLTSFLGWHYAEIGRKEEAYAKLKRVADHMDENGWLPEQVSEYMLAPEHYEGWVKKWGNSARPLLWSHAMFLTLASALGV